MRSGVGWSIPGLIAVFLSQSAWVSPTNFTGFDEWSIQYQVSRWILSVPYANRPLAMLWQTPIALLAPHSLSAWTVLYGVYACGSALLLFVLCRRLLPASRDVAFLSAALLLVWAPQDGARLACVERTQYMGFVFASLLAILGFVEAWLARREALLAGAVLVALLAVRSYEAILPLLQVAPLAVALAGGRFGADLRRWAAAWWGFGLLFALLVAMPALLPGSRSYQLAQGFDPDPLRFLARLADQYWRQLRPLVAVDAAELSARAVPVAVAVFAGAAALALRPAAPGAGWRADLATAGVGLGTAGLGHAIFCLGVEPGAWRRQFLAGPGIALFLAAAASLLSSFVPRRGRRPAVVLVASWVVAVGTARTVAMQRVWDAQSLFAAQTGMLRRLVEAVPDVRPGTLLLLLDDGRAWRSDWSFRYAVKYLYEDRAVGWAHGAWTLMFPTEFTPLGVHCVPWPEIRESWKVAPSLHGFDAIVVVRHAEDGGVRLLEEWPPVLPALPPGARYAPRARIVPAGAPVPARAILGSSAGGGAE